MLDSFNEHESSWLCIAVKGFNTVEVLFNGENSAECYGSLICQSFHPVQAFSGVLGFKQALSLH